MSDGLPRSEGGDQAGAAGRVEQGDTGSGESRSNVLGRGGDRTLPSGEHRDIDPGTPQADATGEEEVDNPLEGESREEFERDRMGQTGADNAAKMIAAHSHVLSSADPKPRVVDTAAQVPTILEMMRKASPRAKKSAGCPECGSLRGVHAKGCSKR